MKPLMNRKILFISPEYFEYEIKVKEKIEELGGEVTFFKNLYNYAEAHTKSYAKLLEKKADTYFLSLLNDIENKTFDYVFIINGETISSSILKKYKKIFVNAEFILYLTETVSSLKGILDKILFFDYVFSFDRKDSETYHFHFRPLFYLDEHIQIYEKKDSYTYDLCFIGTIDSEQYRILKEIHKQMEELGYSMFLYPYIENKFVYYYNKIIKNEFQDSADSEFHYEKLTPEEILNKILDSKVVIDIQDPKKGGLSTRAMEMIAMHKKIITTTTDIQHYDFYTPQNVHIIDWIHPVINPWFIEATFQPLEEHVYDNYSLKAWVLEIFHTHAS